jgi:hypothetical protein
MRVTAYSSRSPQTIVGPFLKICSAQENAGDEDTRRHTAFQRVNVGRNTSAVGQNMPLKAIQRRLSRDSKQVVPRKIGVDTPRRGGRKLASG